MSNNKPPENESLEAAKMRNEIARHYNAQRRYLGERIDAMTETGAKVAAQLDRTLISLSGGALIFSMTFIDKIAPARLAPWLLFASWLVFGISMLSVMFSMQSNQSAATQAIKTMSASFTELEKEEDAALDTGRLVNVTPGAAVTSKITGLFNLIAIGAFILGLILLGLFVVHNIRYGPLPPNNQKHCDRLALRSRSVESTG